MRERVAPPSILSEAVEVVADVKERFRTAGGGAHYGLPALAFP